MQTDKRWRIAPEASADAESLARQLGLRPITARILMNRGIGGADQARSFLNPDLGDLHDPSLIPGLNEAAARVRQAIERAEPIVIYGDYDADGITAVAILMRCLALAGCKPTYYVPDRIEEGYGLNSAAVRKIASEGCKLLITVDCGVNSVEEAALARSLGMDVIITDHHQPGRNIPRDVIVVNPKLSDGHYPFRDLSGAGLAFKLAWAICQNLSGAKKVSQPFREFLVDAVCLAALGTIADVVPLRGENRSLAHYGLRGLGEGSSPGIRALCEASGLEARAISAFDVAFKLAPRLNAAGRLGSARTGIDLLTTDSMPVAREIAQRLNGENNRRQKLQESILQDAHDMMEQGGGLGDRRSIVLAREGWHAGVIGIVAAKIADEHYRPTVLLSLDGDMGQGSARSIDGLHLYEALDECSARLTSFGGHARAAGLRLKRSEVDAFTADFERAAQARLTPEDLVPILDVEAEVRLDDITRPLLDELHRLSPYGEGNPEPVLAAYSVAVPTGARRIGASGRHLAFYVQQGNAALRAVAFGMGDLAPKLQRATSCSLAFIPRLNRWHGTETIEIEVRDIKFGNGLDKP